MRVAPLLPALLVHAACAAAPPAGHARFHNRPAVTVVNDRLDVRAKPASRTFLRQLNRFDMHYHERLTRWMEMRRVTRAADVNALDEVPDSTWFTNRIGVRSLTADEVRDGGAPTGSPEAHLPLVVKSSKTGGTAVGFVAKDQRGVKYILKFDDPHHPELETGADAVTQRLLWACGYFVPEDHVVYLRREDLVLAPDAVVKSRIAPDRPMTRAYLDDALDRVYTTPDGRIRALASQYLDGVPVGGHPPEGVRADDRNDRIPHQQRRELRGAYAIFSWLDHTDMKEDNSLDMYVEDPAVPGVHYLLHYLVDFGNALGAQGALARFRGSGRAFFFDPGDMSRSLLSLGLWRRPWEGRAFPEDVPGVGLFDSATFDPGAWKANTPNYRPIFEADRFDNFWGAKIVARFGPAHIRAAVEAGRYSDPRAVEYLTRTLIERQHKLVRYWFDRVAPLDGFAVEADRLCFDDLALRHGVAGAATATRYTLRAFDREGRPLAWRGQAAGSATGRTCADGVPLARGGDGYTIVRVEVRRGGRALPALLVHLARARRSGVPRVIGLWRL